MSARPDLAGVLAEHYATGGYAPRAGWATSDAKTGSWGCSCGASGPVLNGERVIAHHRAHLAAALNAAIDAWLADEGTREAVGAAIYEATYEVGIDDGVTLDQGRDIAATALAALTTPTTEDHR